MTKRINPLSSIKAAALSLLLLFFSSTSNLAAAEDKSAQIESQLTAQRVFLSQTRKFNQQLFLAVALAEKVHNRKEMDALDERSRRTNSLDMVSWLAAKDAASRAGALNRARMIPELRRELDLEDSLMMRLSVIVRRFVPDVAADGSDIF